MDDVVEDLLGVLEVERAALLRGDFGALDACLSRKSVLIDALPEGRLPDPVRKAAERNEVLISASLRGVRAAGRRIEELLAIQRGGSSYDRKGASIPLNGTGRTLERRA